MNKLLTVKQVAETLGVEVLTVRRMIARGRLPNVRPTGTRTVRVRESDVLAIIDENGPVTVPRTPGPKQGSVA